MIDLHILSISRSTSNSFKTRSKSVIFLLSASVFKFYKIESISYKKILLKNTKHR
jgi:hypothetical protein